MIRKKIVIDALSLFESHYGQKSAVGAYAPGRVNILGGHTDYNDGLVLPIAIEQCVYTLIAPRDDMVVNARSLQMEQPVSFDLREREVSENWSDGIKGGISVLEKNGAIFGGMDILVLSDLPQGAGLSSSAAFNVSVIIALSAIANMKLSPKETALIAQKVENEFMGVNCGILDQMASAASKKDHALLLDCRTLNYEHVPINGDFNIAVCHTGITRSLAASKYNERRAECAKGLEIISKKESDVTSVRDIAPKMLLENKNELGTTIFKRLDHVLNENERVKQSKKFLKLGQVDKVGRLITQAHKSLRDDYQVSCDELDIMVELAIAQKGCYGARMIGGGFGGCAIALVAKSQVKGFSNNLQSLYQNKTNLSGLVIFVTAGNGADQILLSK